MTKKINRVLMLALAVGVLSIATPIFWAQSAEKNGSEKVTAEANGRDSTYRVDFKISELEGEKRLNSRSYTLLQDDRGKKELRIGTRVPVSTGSTSGSDKQQFQYLDVGQSIDCSLKVETEHTVNLNVWMDISNFSFRELPSGETAQESSHGNPIIKQIKLQTSATLELGRPTIIGTLDDPSSKHVFQIEVTATRAAGRQ